MKDAKSYVRDDGAGQTTITSLAYLLTPEGIDPLTAELLRRSLERYSDADFSAAFDGATKDKARQFLAAYNLCRMPFWGAQELAEAMAPCVDHTRALRVIELAQKAEELQAEFSPADGVKWAMGRGFLIGAHAKFLDIAGSYGNPHAPPSGNALAAEPQQTAPATDTATPAPVVSESASNGPAKPMQRFAAQDAAILAAIREIGRDPLALPVNEQGKPGVKAEIRDALDGKGLFAGTTVFDKAWERLRQQGDIADKT